MSLESKIDKLIKAIENLTETIQENIAPWPEPSIEPPEEEEKKPKKEKSKTKKKKTKNVEPVDDKAPEVTIDDVRTGLMVVKNDYGREKVAAILSKLGVKKLSEIDQDEYPYVIKLIKELKSLNEADEEKKEEEDDNPFDI